MNFSCKCLNVSLKSKESELMRVNPDGVDLGGSERADVFFKHNLATINDLDGIIIEQPRLAETRNVGAWAVHRCYNCLTYTHALHREFGTSVLLVNADMLMSEREMENLKASPAYSPVFRIVIDHGKIDPRDLEPTTKFSVTQLSTASRLALEGLEQQLEEAIRAKANSIDEKIRAFTAEQYQILEQFRERVHHEHDVLARVICNESKILNGLANLETPPATPETVQQTKASSDDDVDTTAQLPIRSNGLCHSPSINASATKHFAVMNGHNNHRKTNAREAPGHDVDVEGYNDDDDDDQEALFVLEGMDDAPRNRHAKSSKHDTDTDDSGSEEVYIPRGQRGGGYPALAKSLPVTVPAFHAFGQRLMHEDDDDQISRDPMDPHNIQASIKALAKSVHGDTVFGDLPRPRVSMQL